MYCIKKGNEEKRNARILLLFTYAKIEYIIAPRYMYGISEQDSHL